MKISFAIRVRPFHSLLNSPIATTTSQKNERINFLVKKSETNLNFLRSDRSRRCVFCHFPFGQSLKMYNHILQMLDQSMASPIHCTLGPEPMNYQTHYQTKMFGIVGQRLQSANGQNQITTDDLNVYVVFFGGTYVAIDFFNRNFAILFGWTPPYRCLHVIIHFTVV